MKSKLLVGNMTTYRPIAINLDVNKNSRIQELEKIYKRFLYDMSKFNFHFLLE